jgi:DNA-binding MarR family transcriptional regulator
MVSYDGLAKELYDIFSSCSPHVFPPVARRVSQGEFRMIITIKRSNNDISSGDLALAMRLSSGRTSILLNALEKKGYILREKEKGDHRVVHVHLSKEGETICKEFENQALSYGTRFLSQLGEADANDFLRIVKKISSLYAASENITPIKGE